MHGAREGDVAGTGRSLTGATTPPAAVGHSGPDSVWDLASSFAALAVGVVTTALALVVLWS